MNDEPLNRRPVSAPQSLQRGASSNPQARQRSGTTRYGAGGQRIPGEFNEYNEPIGNPEKHNLPMSRQYQPTDFKTVLAPRGNPLGNAAASAPAQPPQQAGGSTMPQAQSTPKVQTATMGAVSQPPKTPPPSFKPTPQQVDAARLGAAVAANPMVPGVGVAQAGPPSFKPPAPLPPPVAPQSTDWRKPGFVPATVQSQVTSTGRSAPNVRGERNIVVPGNPNQPAGGLAREVNPIEDRMQTFIPRGDALLPRNAAAGMVVNPKYRPANGDAVAYVTTGPAPTARTGRIIDETGDRTAEFVDRSFVPAGVKRQQEETKRRDLAAKIPDGLRNTPFNPLRKVEERYAPPRPMAYDPKKEPKPDFAPAKAASAAPAVAAQTRTNTFQPPAPSRPVVDWSNESAKYDPNKQTLVPAEQPLRTKGIGDALKKGNISEAVAHTQRKAARTVYHATRGTGFEGSAGDAVVQRYAGVSKPTPAPSFKPPTPEPAPQPAIVTHNAMQAFKDPRFTYRPQATNPVDRVLAKYAPQPKKKATSVKSANGSQAQVRFAGSAY